MKNKKGFVFLESVIVLVVVALALTGFLTTYTLLSNNTKRREYYDKTSDKYLLYAISTMGTDGKTNYTTCDTGSNSVSFDKDNLSDDSCLATQFFADKTTAENMFDTAGLVYLYYIENLETALKNNPASLYDNGAIEYMKTLPVNKYNYLIGVFRRSDNYYYASINLDKTTNTYASSVNTMAEMTLTYAGTTKELNALSTSQSITVPRTTTTVTLKFKLSNPDSQVSGATEIASEPGNYTVSQTMGANDETLKFTIKLTPANQDTSKISTYVVSVVKEELKPEPTPDPDDGGGTTGG